MQKVSDVMNMSKDQKEVYYKILERLSNIRVKIEELEANTFLSHSYLTILIESYNNLESIVEQSVPGETYVGDLLESLEGFTDAVFETSKAYSGYGQYVTADLYKTIDELYLLSEDLQTQFQENYPQTQPQKRIEKNTPPLEESHEIEKAITEKAIVIKNVIKDTSISNNEKENEISEAISNLASTTVYETLKQYKSMSTVDVTNNQELQDICKNNVLVSIKQFVKDTGLEPLIDDAKVTELANKLGEHYYDLQSVAISRFEF